MTMDNGHRVTFLVRYGAFGVNQLAVRLNGLVRDGQIRDWHPGRWTDSRHAGVEISFDTAADAAFAKANCLDAAAV